MEDDQEPLLDPASIKLPTYRSSPLPASAASSSRAKIGKLFAGRKPPGILRRARTAPAIVSLPEFFLTPPTTSHSFSILKYSGAVLAAYLCLGILVYFADHDGFSGEETHKAVDALYFCVVTLCTIGYGDIAPLTDATKAFACAFVLVGFGLIHLLVSGAVTHVLELQESVVLAGVGGNGSSNYVFDAEKGRVRIRTKVAAAVAAVALCVGAGAAAMRALEGMAWVDAVYLSVMSVTTVGYGDRSFRTMKGRVFASAWLLVSTLAVGRSFLYLAEARLLRRQRRISGLVLRRGLTAGDLAAAAELSRGGFISKSEYVVYKLKEMGKISEKDVAVISTQFGKLDPYNTGKITLHNLLLNNNNNNNIR